MTGQLRVTGGRLVRRRFAVPQKGVRPTADRARESLFSAFTDEMRGARVLDLFAGSGALGIEALSRGASAATFVERDAGAFRVLKQNLEALSLLGESTLHRGEAERVLARLDAAAFDVVFADPPYAMALDEGLFAGLHAVLAPGGLLVLERSSKEAFTPLSGFSLTWERRYGDATIRVLSRAEVADEEAG